jgi:hypothetical protein
MAFTRLTALWQGAAGLPGYTRMRFDGSLDASAAATAAGRMRAFFAAFTLRIPTPVNITWDGVAQIFDTTGTLTGQVNYTPPALVQGASGDPYSAPSGFVVNWLTGAIFDGHQVRGRTFLVPLTGAAFSADGTPATNALTEVRGAATALVAGTPPLVIFGGKDGAFVTATVTGSNVPDRAAVLRSRRD